ncbi:hypothetical protein OPV22_014306 [Ensete ventricosum]|uniref:Uncharacterized protein n=1 Tax=Ensete ventricosum TaxID=4639 RepID=A0AAV8R1B8_ENSVE|nr:hypothetical protein OPV22_014306 [Ensete ventricosum]
MATSAVVTPGARTPRTTEHARGGAEGPGALLVLVIMGGRLVGVSQKQRRPVASAALPSLFTVAVYHHMLGPWRIKQLVWGLGITKRFNVIGSWITP